MDVKIYITKDKQNFSLEPIFNDGRYCTENECDVAGIYSIPEDIKIIVSGGRLRFDGTIYLINDKGKPAIGIYKLKDGTLKLDADVEIHDGRLYDTSKQGITLKTKYYALHRSLGRGTRKSIQRRNIQNFEKWSLQNMEAICTMQFLVSIAARCFIRSSLIRCIALRNADRMAFL